MSEKQIVIPGLIDMHVHLRDPGYTEAEDFDTGTSAALAGGVVAVFDMPNNKNMPTVTLDRLDEKIVLASDKARTDIGFYYGALPNEGLEIGGTEYERLVEDFRVAGDLTFGLKLYCDITTGNEHKHGADAFRPVVSAWLEANPEGLILAHTEGREATAEMIDLVARQMGGRIHIPHISKKEELEEVIKAKEDPDLKGTVTTGVCPHHLFLIDTNTITLGWFARMKPSLGTYVDRRFLRNNINYIDVIESDHAPHTLSDKVRANINNPKGEVGTGKPTSFGVPGLEAMLPLLLRGMRQSWINLDGIIDMTSTNPAQILGIEVPDSEVHVVVEQRRFRESDLQTKCGWSPYTDIIVGGRIERVVLDGQTMFQDGEMVAKPGDGVVLFPNR